LRIKPKHVID